MVGADISTLGSGKPATVVLDVDPEPYRRLFLDALLGDGIA
jgi:hypothetical protein